MPQAIRIRIGASVDASAMQAFDTIERRSAKLQAKLQAEAAKSASQQARAQQRSAEQQARASEQAAERAVKAEQRASDRKIRELERVSRVAEREMARQARAVDRRATRERESFARRVSHRTTRFLTPNAPLGSIASNAARDIARGVGVDFSLAGGLERTRSIEQRAVDLSNAGFLRGTGGPAGMRQDPAAIIAEARRAGTAGGIAPEAAITGLQAFVGKTGDLETGRQVLADMARLSKATGANLDDMVAAAGDVGAAFGDVAESQQEAERRAGMIRDVMRVIAGQGKLGAVEIKDLASQMAKASTSATAFTGDRSRNIATMGALAQMARQRGGAATANIAATSVASFVNTLRTPARMKAFEAAGVNLEAGGGKFRDPQEIIIEAIKAAGNDTAMFKSMFANVQGARAVEGFRQIFLEAGGGTAGEQAVRGKFRELGAGAAITAGEEAESLARAMNTTTSKAQLFQNRLDEITERSAKKLLPALEAAAPGLEKFAEAIGDVTTWVVSNPKTAIGGAIAASIARAGIESILRASIERAILGSAGARVAGGMAGAGGFGAGGLGMLGPAGLAAAAIALAANEANKLQADLGAKASLADLIPGFSKGSFSADTLLGDLAGLSTFGLVGNDPIKRFGGALSETLAGLHDAGIQGPAGKISLQKSIPALEGSLMQAFAGDKSFADLAQRLAALERAQNDGSNKIVNALNRDLNVHVTNLPTGGDLPPREPQ